MLVWSRFLGFVSSTYRMVTPRTHISARSEETSIFLSLTTAFPE